MVLVHGWTASVHMFSLDVNTVDRTRLPFSCFLFDKTTSLVLKLVLQSFSESKRIIGISITFSPEVSNSFFISMLLYLDY